MLRGDRQKNIEDDINCKCNKMDKEEKIAIRSRDNCLRRKLQSSRNNGDNENNIN